MVIWPWGITNEISWMQMSYANQCEYLSVAMNSNMPRTLQLTIYELQWPAACPGPCNWLSMLLHWHATCPGSGNWLSIHCSDLQHAQDLAHTSCGGNTMAIRGGVVATLIGESTQAIEALPLWCSNHVNLGKRYYMPSEWPLCWLY